MYYEKETWIGLILASIPALFSLYFFFMTDKKRTAILLLLASAFLIRMVMISLDPYLHEWDERFHALVAKNMMSHPFKPMLFAHPIVVHDFKDWSYNHIWLHKQPLFLWQMALSMKVFGINITAMRLPSVFMGTILVLLVHDLSRKWIDNDKIAFIAAFISCFSYWSLELISGRMSTEHNDVAFLFYITCSFWAFTSYIHRGFKLKWALLIGVFVGMAILNKWLAALLIYGGWTIYLILDPGSRYHFKRYTHLLFAIVTTCIVFLPWQIYIRKSFPLESAYSLNSNKVHFSDALGHPGSVFYHIKFLPTAYNYFIILFFIIGLVVIFSSSKINKKLSASFLSMILFLYLFFSIFVKTKMPSYVYPVSSLIHIIASCGLYVSIDLVIKHYSIPLSKRNTIFLFSTFVFGILALKPCMITHDRSFEDEKRNIKIYNTSGHVGLGIVF